ncbi:hypothetical protein HOK51_10015 [Candidatus Woesearchaeota archaeon]|jgi:hypothetical protein|nr:hypothetical protein [Candidatus Woesearchaeota archaeon]MBT6520159.1 hypothetical protein [Candidatus Woesearchaeota archaeon]MBT7366764.1 hypothetical protein [Candidatus Woesearchaeota archaeon]
MQRFSQSYNYNEEFIPDKNLLIRKSICHRSLSASEDNLRCDLSRSLNSYTVIQKLEDKLKVARVHLGHPIGMYIEELELPDPFLWSGLNIPKGELSKLEKVEELEDLDHIETIRKEFGLDITEYLR